MEAREKIKKHITELGMTQTELAKLCGLTFATINRVLNGKQELKQNTLAKIADALNLAIPQLSDDEVKEVFETEVQGYIEYEGNINKIKSLSALQKLVNKIEYETKILPKEAKEIIALNRQNKPIWSGIALTVMMQQNMTVGGSRLPKI